MMYPSASALLFHSFLLLSATCGLPFFFSSLYFAASQPASLVSFLTVHRGTKVVNWYQQQPSTSDTVWTLRRIDSPPIDLISLEDYSVTKPTADRTQPSITLQRSKDNNSVCLEYEARQYCSSEASISISGIYTHAPTGDSIRFTANTANVTFTLPSYLKESPATNLLLLLQTILAVVYWNARLSPSAVGLLVDGNVEEPWRLFTGATAHFDLWHFGMNVMTLSSLGVALENKAIPSMAFLATNLSMILYTGILWWMLQSLLLRIRRVPATNHSTPTVGYSGVLFAWLVVLSLEQGTVCPVFFLPQLCFSSVHIWNGFFIHPGPLVQLILMQLVLPRASWTGHLAGIVVGFVYQWRLLPVTLWWPTISIPMMHFMWCLQQKRQRFLSLRQGLSWRSSSMFMGIVHGIVWVASVLTLGGVGSTMALEYFLVVLWWKSTRSDDATMARGFILLAVLVLVTDAMAAAAWMVVIPSVWTTMLPSVMTLLLRIVALLVSVVWMVHSHRLHQEATSGIFHYTFHWIILKPSHGVLLAIGAANKTSSQESLSSWDHLGTGRRLGGTNEQEMA